MNLTKVARLFSKGNKNTKVDELLEDMPSFVAKEIQEPKGSSWITKAEAKEAKKNFKKERGDSQDPNDKLLLAELDDIILGNVKGIEPTEEILGKGWKEYAQAGNKFEADLKAYPLRFAGDEVDREMFQRKYIGTYDNWATQKEDQVSNWLINTEKGKRYQLENFGSIVTPLGDTSLINKTIKEGKDTELEIMRKLKKENISDITLEDIDRYDFAEGGEADELEIIEALIANGKIEATIKEEIKKEKNNSKKHKLQTLLERIHSGEIDATNIREDMGARKKKAMGGEALTTPEESPMSSQMGKLMGSSTMPDGTEMAEDSQEKPAMIPDEEMEADYVDFVVNQALSPEEQEYLNTELESNDTLSMIFDKVIEVASEFSGEGPVDGPGTEISDSIPARLSDGEFVFTADAVKVIGVEKLEELMEAAEAQYDERLTAYDGGEINAKAEQIVEEEKPIQQNIRVTKETVGSNGGIQEEQDIVGDEIKKKMMLDPYQRHVRS